MHVVMLLFENKGFVMSASDVIVLCKDSDDVLSFFNYSIKIVQTTASGEIP